MKVIYGLENITELYPYACVALGTFDGIHLGHREVIGGAVKRAKEMGGTSMVFTFSPHPLRVITSTSGPKLINSREEKILLLEKMGVDILVFANFTVDFADMHPKEFIKNILKGTLNAKELFVGFNYTFGKNGLGNTQNIAEMSEKFNINVTVMPPVKMGSKIISSTLIRKAITKGNLCEAGKYLGSPYMITGEVIHGKKLGRKLGFPTANLKLVNKVYPPYGVYGVRVIIREREYYGVMNIGQNPTLKPGEHSAETYIFDFEGDIYGETILIEVLEFIREERKFSGVEELKNAIDADIVLWRDRLKSLEICKCTEENIGDE